MTVVVVVVVLPLLLLLATASRAAVSSALVETKTVLALEKEADKGDPAPHIA